MSSRGAARENASRNPRGSGTPIFAATNQVSGRRVVRIGASARFHSLLSFPPPSPPCLNLRFFRRSRVSLVVSLPVSGGVVCFCGDVSVHFTEELAMRLWEREREARSRFTFQRRDAYMHIYRMTVSMRSGSQFRLSRAISFAKQSPFLCERRFPVLFNNYMLLQRERGTLCGC